MCSGRWAFRLNWRECAMRLSVGWNSTGADIEAFLEGFSEVLGRHRERRGRAA